MCRSYSALCKWALRELRYDQKPCEMWSWSWSVWFLHSKLCKVRPMHQTTLCLGDQTPCYSTTHSQVRWGYATHTPELAAGFSLLSSYISFYRVSVAGETTDSHWSSSWGIRVIPRSITAVCTSGTSLKASPRSPPHTQETSTAPKTSHRYGQTCKRFGDA